MEQMVFNSLRWRCSKCGNTDEKKFKIIYKERAPENYEKGFGGRRDIQKIICECGNVLHEESDKEIRKSWNR